MLSTIIHTIRRHALLEAGERVLVAVSGGPDSMALLAALWELAPRLGLTLEVVTVDHGLRDVTAELALVEERAAALGLPWHRVAVDVRAAGVSRGLQEAARRARLAALAKLATKQGCRSVALGHQADDQSETVLFRILRGTGPRGLAGIPYRRAPFVRPLLDVTRAQVLAYLRRRSVLFASDPSNADLHFARARLRHTVLPLLRKENPRVDEALRRLAVEAAAGTSEPLPVIAAAEAAGAHVSGRLRTALIEAARRGGTRSFDVAGGGRLDVSYGRLIAGGRPPAALHTTGERTIPGAGTFVLGPETAVMLREGDERVGVADEADDWAWFDAEGLSWPLVLRLRRPGDRMRPRGGRGSRKLSDLLIDAKVPRGQRASRAVVTDADGELLFVPGLRPSSAGAPTKITRHLVGMAGVPILQGLTFSGPQG
ncbi:MAG TPA: tRNA lysidine(34) synthetase TilS [Polyangia bacterium]|jgi:tRNA(Ile)-lysidine synthase